MRSHILVNPISWMRNESELGDVRLIDIKFRDPRKMKYAHIYGSRQANKGGTTITGTVHTLRPSVSFDLTTHKVEKLDCCWTRGTDW